MADLQQVMLSRPGWYSFNSVGTGNLLGNVPCGGNIKDMQEKRISLTEDSWYSWLISLPSDRVFLTSELVNARQHRMGLDIHIIPAVGETPTEWSGMSFDEPIHSDIFFGSTIDLNQYPQFMRMCDYYSDVAYQGDDLESLIRELADLVPKFSLRPAIMQTLTAFRTQCQQAKQKNMVVWLAAD